MIVEVTVPVDVLQYMHSNQLYVSTTPTGLMTVPVQCKSFIASCFAEMPRTDQAKKSKINVKISTFRAH